MSGLLPHLSWPLGANDGRMARRALQVSRLAPGAVEEVVDGCVTYGAGEGQGQLAFLGCRGGGVLLEEQAGQLEVGVAELRG